MILGGWMHRRMMSSAEIPVDWNIKFLNSVTVVSPPDASCTLIVKDSNEKGANILTSTCSCVTPFGP